MFSKKATSILFLCFSILVAFFNILLHRYQYTLFVIPFVFSCLEKTDRFKLYEVLGLLLIGEYLIFFQDVSIGVMVLLVASVTFFTLGYKEIKSRLFIYVTTATIMAASFLNIDIAETANPFLHAFLDAAIYAVCSFSVYSSIIGMRERLDQKEEAPLDEKYLVIIDELRDIAHEYIATLKQKQREADHDRSGKR